MSNLNLDDFLIKQDKLAEMAFFDQLEMGDISVKPVFVVCAPRVGSTLIYQALANVFNFSYFSNATNDLFSKTPAMGVLRESLGQNNQYLLSYFSQYGKTAGLRETSEGSAIFGNWFGGGHPSEDVCAKALDDKSILHMQNTFSAIKAITRRETVSKNPWNSFRISSLHEYFPEAIFVWIRRSIDAAAISDLENRIARGDPNKIWNSATTSNYQEIQKLPYIEQVVLQQYHYSLSIENSLAGVDSDQVFEVWYEDLCSKPHATFDVLHKGFSKYSVAMGEPYLDVLDKIKPSKGSAHKMPNDAQKISKFINSKPEYSRMIYSV